MKNKQLHKSFRYIVLALLLLIVTVISGGFMASAFAETSGYSSVLTDLQKDGDFDTSKYPDNAKDYSIKVIQVAESTSGELFVYTYQPCQKTRYLVATQVNMSLSETVDGTKLYNLTLVNSSGVFCKYKVDGLTVSKDNIRFYNISSIYREWIKGIDKETGNDNTVNEVSFEVGKRWTACTIDGNVIYSCGKTETILITDKYVDFIRYKNKVGLGYSWLDAHYVAFSTDLPIDELYEVDISFISQEYREDRNFWGEWKETYTWEAVEHFETFTGEDKGENKGGLIHPHYEWDRIQSVSTFKSSVKEQNVTLSETAENNLSNKQWVLRFYESPFTDLTTDVSARWQTRVTDVTILRLKFMTNGVVYNLGVVDNKQAGDDQPGNIIGIVTDEGMTFWQFLRDCIVKTFTGKGSLLEIAVTVVTIVLAVTAVCLIVLFIRFVIKCIRGKKK